LEETIMFVTRTRRPSHFTRLSLLLLAVACGVVFTSIRAGRASAQEAPADRILYYTLDAEVHVMNPDGTGDVNLGHGHSPAWSPDAQKIVFAGNPDGPETTLIYSMNADGSGRTQLSEGFQDFQPSYSPDGSRIVFVSERSDPTFPPGDDMGHTYRLFLMNADGSDERKLFVSGLRAEHSPVFSPDGSQIAFIGMALSQTGTSEYNVYLVGADGTNLRRLTNYVGFNLDPGDTITFTRDGQHVVYTQGRDLKSISVDGAGQPVSLTATSDREEYSPSYSPEGTKLAYAANLFAQGAPDGIYITDLSNGVVSYTNVNGRNPRWMPREVTEPEPTPTPTPEPTPTPAPASADLSILLTASPNAGVGRDLTYTMRVDNHGPDAATGVSLNFIRPAGVNFVSSQASQGQCAQHPNEQQTTQCQLGNIPAGASAFVSVLTVPTAAGEVTAHSSVASGVDDSEQNNNVQPLKITISATCVPEVTGEVVAQVVRNGNQERKQLSHTIVARNTSGRPLHGLVHFVFEGLDRSISGDKGLDIRDSRCLQPLGTRYASVGVGSGSELVWAPGQTITFKVDFFNPERLPVGYRLRVYTGPGFP
jgi:uncharacterized repeat protein (TIGR01451 family)